MADVFVRIDDRLIHGQVVESWVPYLKVDEVVVVSEEAVNDDMCRNLMRLSLPEEVDLKVVTVKACADYIGQQSAALAGKTGKRILVLVSGPGDVLDLMQSGMKISKVNVGGMHYSAGKMQVGRAIFLSEEDRKSLKDISAGDVELEGRGVPSDKPLNLIQLLGN
ncbi:MAG: PTS sugar transporter subunit IIB [Deltaproteobacteria bacterium]|nr:PTS sugar transporter subunit IIB [Deltaproteobacteria bacterium]